MNIGSLTQAQMDKTENIKHQKTQIIENHTKLSNGGAFDDLEWP